MRPNPLMAIRADTASPPGRFDARRAIKTTLEEPCSLVRGAFARLEHSTQHADVGAKGRGLHAHGEGGDLERALADRAAHRLEDVLRLMLRDRSADDDDTRIEHVDETDG